MPGTNYDLIVVGAGVMGLSAAFIAANKLPSRRIAVLERQAVGAGASGFAPGIQIRIGRSERERELAERGSQFWRDIYPNGSWPAGRDCDVLWLTRDPDKLERLSCSGAIKPLRPVTLAERYFLPDFVIPDDVTAVLDRGSYSPVRPIVSDLARRIKDAGVSIVEDAFVDSIQTHSDKIVLRTANGTEYSTSQAILAIGPWMPKSTLLGNAAAEPLLRVKKVVSLHLSAPLSQDSPAIGLFDDYAFLIPMIEEGYWLFSFTSQEWDVCPDSDDLHVSEEDRAQAARILQKWFPTNVPATVSARVFCDCYAGDGIPFSYPAKDIRGLRVIGGGAGNGFRFGPPCAQDALSSLYPQYHSLLAAVA